MGKTKAKSRGKLAKPAAPARARVDPSTPKSSPAARVSARLPPRAPASLGQASPAPASLAQASPARSSSPLPPPPRDELPAPRDVARLLRYGERFAARKIDVRMLPLQLTIASGALALVDPGVPKSWRVFDRPIGAGHFRVMLSVARGDDGSERLAAVVIHVGRPPITRWSVAHYAGQKRPKTADQIPRCGVTTGWLALIDAGQGSPGTIAVPVATGLQPIDLPLTDGRHALALPCGNGDYAAYWAIDAADKPICLVIDFDVFTQKEWKARPAA